jgi:hypothetical protein
MLAKELSCTYLSTMLTNQCHEIVFCDWCLGYATRRHLAQAVLHPRDIQDVILNISE